MTAATLNVAPAVAPTAMCTGNLVALARLFLRILVLFPVPFLYNADVLLVSSARYDLMI